MPINILTSKNCIKACSSNFSDRKNCEHDPLVESGLVYSNMKILNMLDGFCLNRAEENYF